MLQKITISRLGEPFRVQTYRDKNNFRERKHIYTYRDIMLININENGAQTTSADPRDALDSNVIRIPEIRLQIYLFD